MGERKDVLGRVFSYRNEHDREGDALTIITGYFQTQKWVNSKVSGIF